MIDTTTANQQHQRQRVVQEHFSGVKAEARRLLENHRVTKMTMRPVRRSYGFENPGVPHGEQYVLKVKYPASQPALPLGLEGARAHTHVLCYFCARPRLLLFNSAGRRLIYLPFSAPYPP